MRVISQEDRHLYPNNLLVLLFVPKTDIFKREL